MVMFAVAGLLLYLAIVKDYEPLLLLPIAAGCLLANLPLSPVIVLDGLLTVLYDAGIENELFPLLIFIGIGAMTDFGPLLENPKMVLLALRASSASSRSCCSPSRSGSPGPRRRPSASLARSTAPPPSTSPGSWRHSCWVRSPWPRTATWRSCR